MSECRCMQFCGIEVSSPLISACDATASAPPTPGLGRAQLPFHRCRPRTRAVLARSGGQMRMILDGPALGAPGRKTGNRP
jgi:hypothetical protein